MVNKYISHLKQIFSKVPDYKFFLCLFLFACIIYSAGIIRVKSILWGDSLYYYAYTHSFVIDRDIDFTNEAFHPLVGFPNPAEMSARTGRITNKFSPGTAIAWIPGMVAGQIVSYSTNLIFGTEVVSTDGYGVITQYLVGVSSIVFSVLGAWFVYKTILLFFPKNISRYTLVLLFLTSTIFYYTAVDPLNSHSISFFLSSYLWFKFANLLNKKITWQKVIPLGLIAGALVLVRNQDIVVTLPIVLYLVFSRKEAVINKLNWFTLFVGSAFVVASIQLYTTLELFGVLASPYLLRGESLSWFSPDFLRVLFSFENGIFIFSPSLFVSLAFLVLFISRKEMRKSFCLEGICVNRKIGANNLFVFSIAAVSAFILQLYVIASWAPEIVGGPYGSRMFTSILPHLALGLGIFITWLRQKFTHKYILVYSLILIALTINMLLQTVVMLYRF